MSAGQPATPRHELIRTARLELRPLELAAARALLAGEPAALRLGPGWPHPDSLTVVRAALELGWPTWLIWERASDQVIGECGLKGWADASGAVEIGYGLAGPFRGRGYGREAVAGVCDWLAERGHASAVIAEVAATNVASRRLVASLGFQETEARGGYLYYRKPLLTRE